MVGAPGRGLGDHRPVLPRKRACGPGEAAGPEKSSTSVPRMPSGRPV
eukprot:CAMPEP_0176007788 /NCGR_PEP_ID=MMETSP0120_2-20121206/3413_1 /TAXON_ID=160619 /ORGANISM="Kryptoperidinium foliaceum, Strain CCMP 1326" /LENGTH=46 /DNA_ID= /DNA_START= /DNA_END= /DNA_ORIENTATION=